MDTLKTLSDNHSGFYGVSSDVIFTTIITISIFILGIVIKEITAYIKELFRKKYLRNYFIRSCEFLRKPIMTQIGVFKEYSTNFSSEAKIEFVYKDTTDLELRNFDNVSNQDLYRIFYLRKRKKSDERTKMFNDIINSLNFIRQQRINSLKNFDQFYSGYREYETQWQNNGDAILRYFDTFVSQNKTLEIKPSEDPFIKEYDSIVHNWQKNVDDKNIFRTHDNLISPLRDICKKYIGDPRANTVLNFVVGASYAFDNIKGIKKMYSEFFANEASELDDKYKRLINAINYFK